MSMFSNSDRDISNNEGDAFWRHYGFLIAELLRVAMPGRIHAVHCMQLPTSKSRDGFVGMRDFRGEIVRAWEAAGCQPCPSPVAYIRVWSTAASCKLI